MKCFTLIALCIVEIFCGALIADETVGHLLALQTSLQSLTERLAALETKYGSSKELSVPHPDPHGSASLTVAELEKNGWNLVFRATSGNGQPVYNAWMTGQCASTTKPVDMTRSYTSHYRQDNLNNNWANLNVKYVKFALYRDNREVGYVIFDAQGINFTDWFSKEKVVDASWSDLTNSATYNFFSIAGADDTRVLRRFFINTSYGGCAGDVGHFAVIEQEGICHMDKHLKYPQFVYANLNSADIWEKQQFGRADYMAIFVSV